ncbi:MAG: CvpA family protein [Clostridiales bacterium]|nr:CvpA family protein [Clostridiales bacterium]
MSEKMPNMDYDADEVINDFKAKFKWGKTNEVDVVVKPPKVWLKILISALATVILGGIVYYMMLPALNFHDSQMYIFIIILLAIFMFVFSIVCKANKKIERREYVKKKSMVPVIITAVILVIMGIGWLAGATIFRASSYSNIMPVTTSDFSTDFQNISVDGVPRIDESRALTLADQQLGSLSEYKSQYVVSDTTTMINYNGRPVRTAYLEYADVFKWFNNTKEGLPAYMIIDLISQKVTVVNCLEQFGSCIKYSQTELFNEKLIRHIRFQYPTELLDTPNFEVTDDGHPYWITPVLKKTIGLFGGTDVKGAVITDALTGESQYHSIEDVRSDESLQWIDAVYPVDLLIQQYDYYGKLKNGFWNSIIFQNDVNLTSHGYGYIAMNDDAWMYTGVTSSEADSSNFGFIFSNQRTKETRYYQNGGAIESAAQSSAEDAVQNYQYKSTFPILLDIEGHPTYFMSLYGDSNTVKGYALVNLKDKTIVGTGLTDTEKSDEKALNAAVENYIEALADKGIVDADVDVNEYLVSGESSDSQPSDTQPSDSSESSDSANPTVTGKVDSIKTSVNNGNTFYYFEINGKYYYISVADCMEALLVNMGDNITVTVGETANGDFVSAESLVIN